MNRIARALRLALALAPASCGDSPASASASASACAAPCGSDQRCYAPTGECVLRGVVSCEPRCASYEQCSARAARATCFAQVCALPPRPATTLWKVVGLSLLPQAEGCDLTGDGRADARLSELTRGYAELPEALRGAIAADRITVFLHPHDARLDLLFGTLAPESRRCDPSDAQAGCRYTVTRESYDRGARSGPCPAWLSLGEASTRDAQLRAGGPTSDVGIAVPIGARQFLMQLHRVQLDGATVSDAQGVASATLRLCGAVPRQDLLTALEGLPDDALAPVGGLAAARNLLGIALRADIDRDSDGDAESVSFALQLRAVRAAVTGWSPTM